MVKRRSTRGCRTEDDGSIFLSEQVFNFRVQKHLNSVLFIKTSCVNVLKVPLELWSAQNHGSTTVSVLGGTAKSTHVPKNRTSPAETAGLPQRLEVSIITGRSTTVENVRDPLCKLQQKRLFGVSQMDAEERANGMIKE
jgi:hypothetical protein